MSSMGEVTRIGTIWTDIKDFRIVLTNGSVYKDDYISIINDGKELITRTNDGRITVYNMRHVIKYEYRKMEE